MASKTLTDSIWAARLSPGIAILVLAGWVDLTIFQLAAQLLYLMTYVPRALRATGRALLAMRAWLGIAIHVALLHMQAAWQQYRRICTAVQSPSPIDPPPPVAHHALPMQDNAGKRRAARRRKKASSNATAAVARDEPAPPVCCVCIDAPLKGMFTPCRHICTCLPCGTQLM